MLSKTERKTPQKSRATTPTKGERPDTAGEATRQRHGTCFLQTSAQLMYPSLGGSQVQCKHDITALPRHALSRFVCIQTPFVRIILESTVGKQDTRARHIEQMSMAPSQSTPELGDDELLIQLPLLLDTNGAAAIEAGGDIVRPAAGAPGKSSEAGRHRPLPRDVLHPLPRPRPAGIDG